MNANIEADRLDPTILLKKELIEWLLQGEPWVTYHTLTNLLDKDEHDKLVLASRKALSKHSLIRKIFTGLNQDGFWGTPKDIHT